ncbi:uncharacterized protein LOC143623390 [Bidens hawaiensis]|uniref:uncharacterized protein LOC143623390 n=1 Tax=Bidens hawaiensis TaxID=980011 RepID=UPI00404ADB12
MEKLALALVYASRRLCRYFHGHPINVLTNYKILNVLRKPKLSGQLEKWAIDLGEHTLQYKPRPTIKDQILADFIAEVPTEKEDECKAEEEPTAIPEENETWMLFTDGASNDEGSWAGLKLLTNLVDSMLIASQVNGSYEAKDEVMASYFEKTRQLTQKFKSCNGKHIKRSENKSADALSKLATTSFKHLEKEVRVETLAEPSAPPRQVCITQNLEGSWMTPIKAYLAEGILLQQKAEAQKVKHKALQYQLRDGILYRRPFIGPLLHCVDAEDASYLIREIHEGICGLHARPRMVVAKITNAGYYWPDIHTDAVK